MTTIGIDARAAAEVPAGRGRLVRELLRAFAQREDNHRYLLYARSRWDVPLDERFEWRLRGLGDPLWHVWTAFDASRRADVFLSTNSYLTAWFTTVPTALVVYDTVAWDAPESAQRRAQRIERATARFGLRSAASVICISDATRRDLVARFPSAAAKSHVVPLAADERFARAVPPAELERVRAQYGLEHDFVLHTGTLEPRKNLLRVLRAHEGLQARIQLALVGPAGWEFEPILEEAGRREDVRLIDHVPDEDLAVLYHACTVFCYPSLYEGFGLPLLEAMAAGAACITSNATSLPEVGGNAVVYVDPTDIGEIRAALETLLSNARLRARLGEAAKARSAEFSWDRTAATTLETVISLAERRRRRRLS